MTNTRWSFRKVTEGDGSTAWRHVHFAPLTAAEADVLEEYRQILVARMAPCAPDALIVMLTRLSNHFKNERSPQEWQILFRDYLDDLAEYSEEAIAQALIEHRRNKKWFPKVAELRAACAAFQSEGQHLLDRCTRVMNEGGAGRERP